MKPAIALAIVYAKDARKVAGFYQQTLALAVLDEEPDFILLGNASVEIAVVRMRAALAKNIYSSVPPALRDQTPIKCSYEVADLAHVCAAAAATGGGTKPIKTAWRWRGQRHLDGHDPEGNVVQFRQRDAR